MNFDLETLTTIIFALSLMSNGISVLVSKTDTPLDDLWWARIYPYLEKAALIFGKAKDK